MIFNLQLNNTRKPREKEGKGEKQREETKRQNENEIFLLSCNGKHYNAEMMNMSIEWKGILFILTWVVGNLKDNSGRY